MGFGVGFPFRMLMASALAAGSIAEAKASASRADRYRLYLSSREVQTARTALAADTGPLAKAAAGPFRIDTCTNTGRLFYGLAQGNLPLSVTLGPLARFGARTQTGLYHGLPALSADSLPDGVVLSTGNVNDINDERNAILSPAVDNTDNPAPSTGFQREEIKEVARAAADPDLRVSADDFKIYDAASLKLEFTTTAEARSFSIDFQYGSMEYPEYLKSVFNDIFMVFLDGKNVAFDSLGRAICVSNNFFKIENIRTQIENGEVVPDDGNPGFLRPEILINGFTPPLRAQANLPPGKHTLEFVIVDISDAILNSSVFLTNLRFRADSVDPGTRRVADLIADQAFTVPETLPPGAEVGVLAALASKDTLAFTVLSGPSGVALDAKTGRLTVAQGASLVPYRGQTLIFQVEARSPGGADIAAVSVHVSPVDAPNPPPVLPPVRPPLFGVSGAAYSDADGDGKIDRAILEFAAKPRSMPERVRLRDPFVPGASLEVAGPSLVVLDSARFRLDFPEREFAFGTAFVPDSLGRILGPDSVFSASPFRIDDAVGPLPIRADAIAPQRASDKPTLTLAFSEAVNLDLGAQAFPYEIKRPGAEPPGHMAVESIRKLADDRYLYTFASRDYPLPGDSLRAVTDNPFLADAGGNRVRMSYFIPVAGLLPAPPLVLQAALPGMVSYAPATVPLPIRDALLIGSAGRPGACLDCRDPRRAAAWERLTAGVPYREAHPHLMRIKINGPIRYDLRFFTNRGEFVNQAKGAVDADAFRSLPADGEGNRVLTLYWWPVSHDGRWAATGAYVMRGSILGTGEADPLAPAETGFANLANRSGNISRIFGYLRR